MAQSVKRDFRQQVAFSVMGLIKLKIVYKSVAQQWCFSSRNTGNLLEKLDITPDYCYQPPARDFGLDIGKALNHLV